LHKWFTTQNRPLPRFLVIDQPSQVYFPRDPQTNLAEDSHSDDDRLAVVEMYKLAFELTKELAPSFQIIMTDHADLNETWFQEAVIGRWRGDEKLVPLDWIPNQPGE